MQCERQVTRWMFPRRTGAVAIIDGLISTLKITAVAYRELGRPLAVPLDPAHRGAVVLRHAWPRGRVLSGRPARSGFRTGPAGWAPVSEFDEAMVKVGHWWYAVGGLMGQNRDVLKWSVQLHADAIDGLGRVTFGVGKLAARTVFGAAKLPNRAIQRQHIAARARKFGPLDKARLAAAEIERGRQLGDDELVAIGEATIMAAGVAANQDDAVPDYVTAEIVVLGRGLDPNANPLVSDELAKRVTQVREAFARIA